MMTSSSFHRTACIGLLAVAWGTAPARGVVVFIDTGDVASGVQGGPIDHSNPDIMAAPGATVSVHVWALPEDDDARTLVALGHDIRIGGTARGAVSATRYVLDNPAVADHTRWDGVAVAGGLNNDDLVVADARAVFVPRNAPFAAGLASATAAVDPGFDPNSGAVHLGRLDLEIDATAIHGTFVELRLAVGPLTIAPATTAEPRAEPVYFGYVGSGPEAADGAGADVGATSLAYDARIDIARPCTSLADCADLDGDGIRDDRCTWWACTEGWCASTAVKHADMGGAFGACPPDGVADGNDRFHALNCFANVATDGPGGYPCEASPPAALNVDAGGPFDACPPDGVCDGNDAFRALASFGGPHPCATCPADGGPAPQGPVWPAVTTATLRIAAGRAMLRPGELVDVHVFLDSALDSLRGYQLHTGVSGGRRGMMQLVDIYMSKPHSPDAEVHRSCCKTGWHFAPAFAAGWSAFNVATGQMVAGTDDPGGAVEPGYLATFTYRAAPDARGTFAIDLLRYEDDTAGRTFLFPATPGARITLAPAAPALIHVVESERDAPRTGPGPGDPR